MNLYKALAVVLVLLCAGCSHPPPDPNPITFGFYLVKACGSPGASPPMQLNQTAESYCLERTPVVDQTGVSKASVDQDRPSAVDLTFAKDSGARMLDATQKNVGRNMGFVLNGQLKWAPMITSPTSRVEVQQLAHEEATMLVDKVNREALAAEPEILPPGKRSDAPQPEDQIIGYTPKGYPIISNLKIYTAGRGIPAPVVIHTEQPEYTPQARAAGIQGTVVLEAVVLPSGVPDYIRVVRPLNPGLDAKAIECAKKYRFRPTGMAAKATIEIEFKL